jgi:uncharacterized membrane protein
MKPVHEIQPATPANGKEVPTAIMLQAKMAPRWAAIIGILALGVLYALLPARLRIVPGWSLLAIEVVLLLPVVLLWITHRTFSHKIVRILSLVILGFVTLALASGVILLVITLPGNTHPKTLLPSAGLLWSFNVIVFALWYWEIDGGGPLKRHQAGHQAADFMFPQQVNGNDGGWVPHFLDYLFLAFTGATALSPADTYPLTRPAKTLMMIEALLSMLIILLLAGRAVNIL